MTTSTMLRLPLKVFDEDIRQVVILDADGNWIAKVDTQWAGPFAPRSMAQQIVTAVNAFQALVEACAAVLTMPSAENDDAFAAQTKVEDLVTAALELAGRWTP